jgi:hypothetical protein
MEKRFLDVRATPGVAHDKTSFPVTSKIVPQEIWSTIKPAA